MWVILEEGTEFEGIGTLDNDPYHSDIKAGSLIRFEGGTETTKPYFVEVLESAE